MLIMIIFQNVGNQSSLNIGNYNSRVPSTILIIIIKAICILFWTWVLNLICKAGHKGISWFLVLLPFILMFFMMWVVLASR
jgi:small-conductance mechanosensitive channel